MPCRAMDENEISRCARDDRGGSPSLTGGVDNTEEILTSLARSRMHPNDAEMTNPTMTSTDLQSPLTSRPLAIVVPCLDEAENLRTLLPMLKSVADTLDTDAALYVLDGGSKDGTPQVAAEHGVAVLQQRGKGYGGAIRTALEDIDAEYILTLDADFSHPPAFIRYLWAVRDQAEIVIASRYAPQGFGAMPLSRTVLSGLLNVVFRKVLSLDVHDLSSGFRLYRRRAVCKLNLTYDTYAILQEILVKSYCEGYRVREIPFHYRPRKHGSTHARLFQFAVVYLKALRTMRNLRNSIESADYDSRAFFSRIPLQRWWQRRRYRIILDLIGAHMRVLDAGCGSTQMLNGAPQIVGMDLQHKKLRFMRRAGRRLVNASTFDLPFKRESFDVVVSSQVIEHIPEEDQVFEELDRVLAPGGMLIVGTVDYGRPWWPMIEKAYAFFQPRGYADEHITRYTFDKLKQRLEGMGYVLETYRYIMAGEMILQARKPAERRPRIVAPESAVVAPPSP